MEIPELKEEGEAVEKIVTGLRTRLNKMFKFFSGADAEVLRCHP